MSITLRGDKGTALTHTELDNNFREFFYSASVDGSALTLFRSSSLPNNATLEINPSSGIDGSVQLKNGTTITGSDALVYDLATQHLHVSGNLTLTGNITAQEYHTEYVSASIIFESGSTAFGNSADDIHSYTGSMQVEGRVRVEGNVAGSTSFHVVDGYVVLTEVSASLNYPDDAAAAAAGVPLGGLYRNGNFIQIRIT